MKKQMKKSTTKQRKQTKTSIDNVGNDDDLIDILISSLSNSYKLDSLEPAPLNENWENVLDPSPPSMIISSSDVNTQLNRTEPCDLVTVTPRCKSKLDQPPLEEQCSLQIPMVGNELDEDDRMMLSCFLKEEE